MNKVMKLVLPAALAATVASFVWAQDTVPMMEEQEMMPMMGMMQMMQQMGPMMEACTEMMQDMPQSEKS